MCLNIRRAEKKIPARMKLPLAMLEMLSKRRPERKPLYWKWMWSTMNNPMFVRSSKIISCC